MVPEILQKDATVLRKKAAEVPPSKIKSAKVQKVLKDMASALSTQDDGVALAAPQIGVSLRIFIVAKAALKMPERIEERRRMDDKRKLKQAEGYLTFINPVIAKLSREKAVLDEGCLSVRPLYGKIRRSKKASIRAYDENGKLFERGASGLLAQIFQHETDHLEGILFIDKATDMKELPSP
jgi:peptide deformylase